MPDHHTDINIHETINSGQIFLWENYGNEWFVIDGHDVIKAKQKPFEIITFSKKPKDFFREDDNYGKILKNITKDKIVKKAISEPCVVISPAGMLVGGNAVFYMQEIASNDKNGIAMVSYQAEGTPGKKMLETGKISTRGKDMKVKATVRQFQFSGHGDRTALFDMIKNIKGDPKVLTVHGDENSCTKFAEEIQEKFGLDAYAPKLGEEIAV